MADEQTTTAQEEKKSASPLEEVMPIRTNMEWLRIERPAVPKPTPGPKGMRLRDVENEHTLVVPDVWPFVNDTPRGSIPAKTPQLAAGYSIFDKVTVWSDNCIDLYEDAIYDRWSSATTLPWDTLTPLPDVTEAAIDQICTELSEQAYLDVQVLGNWLEKISYGFKEVKNFLATYVFDRSRHTEAFRKRALANGGGLGIEGPCIYHRALLGAMVYPDLQMAMFLRALWTKTVCEAVAEHARTEVDRQLFSLAAQDCGRHVAYQMGLVSHMLSRAPEKAIDLHFALIRHEPVFVADLTHDTSFTEALALALADDPAEGLKLVEDTKRQFVRSYLSLTEEAGLTGRIDRLHPKLKELIEEPVAAG
jgi:hypothetical protein